MSGHTPGRRCADALQRMGHCLTESPEVLGRFIDEKTAAPDLLEALAKVDDVIARVLNAWGWGSRKLPFEHQELDDELHDLMMTWQMRDDAGPRPASEEETSG